MLVSSMNFKYCPESGSEGVFRLEVNISFGIVYWDSGGIGRRSLKDERKERHLDDVLLIYLTL